jgi:hypothetical protein
MSYSRTTLYFIDGFPGFMVDFDVHKDYGAFPRTVCQCIKDTVTTINNAEPPLPYAPVPNNYLDISTANSNYAAKCLLKNCGLPWDIFSLNPVGWGHRMNRCAESHTEQSYRGDDPYSVSTSVTYCDRWERTDTAWCGP